MTDPWKKNFEPSFLDAANECTRHLAQTGPNTRKAYFQLQLRFAATNGPPEKDDVGLPVYKDLENKLAKETPASSVVVPTGKDEVATLGLAPIHFLYMDVGCWTGDGDPPGWRRHREFGVVYGHIAILCAFGDEPRYYTEHTMWKDFDAAKTAYIDDAVKSHPDFPKIRDFLQNLSGLGATIGELHIVAAASLASKYIPAPKPDEKNKGYDPIHVFIGDLHAPVADNETNTHIIEGNKALLRGRLDLVAPLGWNIATAMTSMIPGFWPVGLLARMPAWLAYQVLTDMNYEAETTVVDSANKWVHKYHANGGQGAEIFQSAGQDLRQFVDYLQAYHKSTHPLHVVQLGDFFDLWIGFQRAFSGSISSPQGALFGKLPVQTGHGR